MSTANPSFAAVALPMPLDQLFTYSAPERLRERAVPGMRVVVPFRTGIETGFIVSVSSETDIEKPRDILELPDALPAFSQGMLDLCRWMATYYCCSWGEALWCAVPAGMRIGSAKRYRIHPEAESGARLNARQDAVVAAIIECGPMTSRQLAKIAGSEALSATLKTLVKRRILLAEPLAGPPGVSIRTETWVRLVEDHVPDPETLAALQRTAPKQAAVYLDLLHFAPERPATELYQKHNITSATLTALARKNYIARFEREFYRAPNLRSDAPVSGKHVLNEEQQAAYQAIVAAAEENRFATFLLRGVTGSGKTEVYLQAIEHILALGKDAIILVPEISLTPQTVGRFYERFDQNIAVLHSGLGTGERYDEWRRAQRGEVRIVVGARSAVFAPLPRLGIIVVDEEHDSSYKQSETPRYHARDVAIMRMKNANGVCVLGSATPSVESYYNSEQGKSVRINLLQRATHAALPEVKLVDMRIEATENAGHIILSKTLEDAVNKRIAAHEQVILLLNRRGFAPHVLCPQCGWLATCENCQVGMTYHSHGGELRCHYCGASRPKPGVCGNCHFNPLLYLGAGTQKAEEYLLRAFPGANVERMDADTTSGKGGHAKILGRFAKGEIDILIGTQMLAKGHDYPGVTLVGVINADTGLAMPDFRAAEQTFQLLTQVAGRAGRGGRPGEVYIQTFRPKHYAIRAAQGHNYAAFYEQEIEHRRGAGYPPFRRMANMMIESEDPEHAEREALRLRRIVRECMEQLHFSGMELLGPSPAAILRVNKKYRWNLGILSRSGKRINEIARAARMGFEEKKGSADVELKVDLDPYGIF